MFARSLRRRPALGPGDVLVLPKWERAARSMLDGSRIIQRVAAVLPLTSAMGQDILAFPSAFAPDERERIVKRAQDASKAANARGLQFGRTRRLTQASTGRKPSAAREWGVRKLDCGGFSMVITPSLRGCQLRPEEYLPGRAPRRAGW